ncbi:MAG: Amuc_1100 family pilus-like protein [Verrucomicrobiota bacterium]
MKFLPKQYRGIVTASTLGLLGIGGSGAYFGFSLDAQMDAKKLLEEKSAALTKILNSNSPPSAEQLKQLEQQKESYGKALRDLRESLSSLDFIVPEQSPQDFQKSLNDKTLAFASKAEKYTVSLPQGFYMDFDQYLKKLPAPEAVPLASRRLSGADTLLDDLLESRPVSLRGFKIRTPEQRSEAEAAAKQAAPPAKKPDPKTPKAATPPPPPPAKPVLEAQTFTIQFTARPDSLRDFINALANETRGIFVTRKIKIVNSKEKEPPVKGNQMGLSTGETAPMVSQLGGGTSFGRYVLGDENVEVEMTIDLISLVGTPTVKLEKETAKQP